MAEWIDPGTLPGCSVAAVGLSPAAVGGVDPATLATAVAALVRDGVEVAVGVSGVDAAGATMVAGEPGLRRFDTLNRRAAMKINYTRRF